MQTQPNFRYPLSASTWDQAEIDAIQSVIESGRYTMGPKVKAFEEAFAEQFGSQYAIMVNSGSSANLLMLAALRYRKTNPIPEGAEIIVPAISWSTTYYPVTQLGYRLRFVDVDRETYNLDLDAVETGVTPETKAVFAVNVLGCPNDFTRLRDICNRHGLILIEDNCESMGAKWDGKQAGTWGELGSFSTFFSHHICTMEGGVIATDSEELMQTLKSLRAHGWTRELPDKNWVHDKDGDDFRDLYRFVLPGYNVRPIEMSGATGLTQLKKLPSLLEGRHLNAKHFDQTIGQIDGVVPQKHIGESSHFAFAMSFEGRLLGRRTEVVRKLQEAGIECRPMIAGNFVHHPVIKHLPHSVAGELKNADHIHENAIYIGNHHFDLREQISEAAEIIRSV